MPKILHLGLGNFHRAHQAWYTAQLPDWSITAVVMTNTALHDAMALHDNKYLLGIWGPRGLNVETMGAITKTLLASTDADEISNEIAQPHTQVVTLTVTEKGYYLRTEDTRLDCEAPAIAADIASEVPKTVLGLLAAGLRKRADNSAGPLTVLSCDNMNENGDRLRSALSDYVAIKYPDLQAWIDAEVSFPNTMVDRITPSLSDDMIQDIQKTANDRNPLVVGTETFSEWIIEDRFKGSRPDWDKAGAAFVADISFYEHRKLRLLNAAHSYLAYAGLLRGHQYVHEAIADTELREGTIALWDEAVPTLDPSHTDEIEDYREALLVRFAVPQIRHRLEQIAADGSLKLRERLVPTLKARAQKSLASPRIENALQSWADFVIGRVEANASLNDANAHELHQICQRQTTREDKRQALFRFVGQ